MSEHHSREDAPAAALRVRPPTYTPPYPLIVVESAMANPGQWLSAQLAASDHVDDTYWVDVGENHADVYAEYPGARVVIVEHTGRWTDKPGTGIFDQVRALERECAVRAEVADPPPVVVVDGVTGTWEACKRWAAWRATQSRTVQAALNGVPKPGMRRNRQPEYVTPPDPHMAISIPENLWDAAHERHRALISVLRRMRAIVVVHAHTRTLADGTAELDTHRDVLRAAHAWVRVPPDGPPVLASARAYNHYAAGRFGTSRDEHDIDTPAEALTLEHVVFEVLGVPRHVPPEQAGQDQG